MSKRLDRAATAAALAPTAPPCFSSRGQWLEYVQAAAVDQRAGHLPGPLVLVAGEPARFNPDFCVCAECDDRYAAQMAHQGKCKPRYLIELFAAQAATKETA